MAPLHVTRHIKRWRIVILLGTMSAAIVTIYSASTLSGGLAPSDLHQAGSSVTQQGSDLEKRVPISGRLVFPRRERLTFDTAGKVGEVLVIEGQQVKDGQVLARLDALTLSRLSRDVARERVNLDRAQEALADLVVDHSQRLSQARQAKAAADVALDRAQEALADLVVDHSQHLAQARQAKAAADVTLDQAQEGLVDLALDHVQRLAQARQARVNAELALDNAAKDLVNFTRDYHQRLAQARQAKADTELALDKARDALVDFARANDDQLAQALRAKDRAEDALRQAKDTLDKFENDRFQQRELAFKAEIDAEKDLADAEQALFDFRKQINAASEARTKTRLQGLQAAVDLARSTLQRARNDLVWSVKSPLPMKCPEFQSAPLQLHCRQLQVAVSLAEGNLKKAQDDLVDLEAGPEQLKHRQLQAAVPLAQASLKKAQDDLAELEPGPDPLKLRQLQAAVALAQESLKKAQDDLADLEPRTNSLLKLQKPASEAQLARANSLKEALQSKPAAAQLDLALSNEAIAAIEAGADPLEVVLKERQVALAGANLSKAQMDLVKLQDSPDPLEVALKERQMALAKANLGKAQMDLAKLQDNPDPLEAALREAEVAFARRALEEAIQRFHGATIRAPFAGTISLIGAGTDDEVSSDSHIMEIVDPTVVQVVGFVDASDIWLVREGAKAMVTMDTLPGQVLEGAVATVATAPRTERGVVTYPVTIRIDVPDGVQVPVKLSAVSGVVINQ